jgi:hypothetical protein
MAKFASSLFVLCGLLVTGLRGIRAINATRDTSDATPWAQAAISAMGGLVSSERLFYGDFCVLDKHCPPTAPYCVLSGKSKVCRPNPLVDISNVTIEYEGQVSGSPWTINTEFTELTFAFENTFSCTNNANDTDEQQSGTVKFTVTPHHHDVAMSWDVDGLVEVVASDYDISVGYVAPIGKIDFNKPYFFGASVQQVDDETCLASLPNFTFDDKNFISVLEKGKSYDIFFGADTLDGAFNSDKMFYTLSIDYTKLK